MVVLFLDEPLHALEHRDDSPQETVELAVEQLGLCGAGGFGWWVPDAVAARVLVFICVIVVDLALAPERILERDGEAEGEARDLDREVRAAAEVEVGELAEGALHFEQAGELVVEREDACSAG